MKDISGHHKARRGSMNYVDAESIVNYYGSCTEPSHLRNRLQYFQLTNMIYPISTHKQNTNNLNTTDPL